jgi:hypothetical protein
MTQLNGIIQLLIADAGPGGRVHAGSHPAGVTRSRFASYAALCYP